MNKTKNSVLLMTATITPPPGVPFLQRSDPNERLQDYCSALEFYLEKLGKWYDYIVFVDNSQSDLSKLEFLVKRFNASERVELISFDGLNYPPSHGRAYGEFMLLDYAIDNSKLLNQQDDSFVVWKVTGRYKVLNLNQIMKGWTEGLELLCHCRNYRRRWVEMYCFGITLNAYRRLMKNVYRQFREDEILVNAEIVWRMLIDDWQALKVLKIKQRFKITPQIVGISAHKNQPYHSGKRRQKYLLREVARLFAPWVWV